MSKESINLTSLSSSSAAGMAAAGAVLQYGVGLIPEVGGLLKTILGIFWPANKNIWEQIKDEVKELIDEEIDDATWERLSRKIDEIKDKVETVKDLLVDEDYQQASTSFMDQVDFLVGVQEDFKVKGESFKYAFAPLFVAVVNIKLFLYIEGLRFSNEMSLTKENISYVEGLFKSDISDAKEYIAQVEGDVEQYSTDNIYKYFNTLSYYRSSVMLFNSLWGDQYSDFEKVNELDNYYIPVVAAGTFYKTEETIFAPMSFSEIYTASTMPASNVPVNGVNFPYTEPSVYPSGLLSKVCISTDKSPEPRTTGISLQYSGSSENYEMGMVPDNSYYDYSVTETCSTLDFSSGEYINSAKIYAENFVSRIELGINGSSNDFEVGQSPDNDATYSGKVVYPFSINGMYVPSDFASYNNSSGHEIGGLAISAIYNNELAKQLVLDIISG